MWRIYAFILNCFVIHENEEIEREREKSSETSNSRDYEIEHFHSQMSNAHFLLGVFIKLNCWWSHLHICPFIQTPRSSAHYATIARLSRALSPQPLAVEYSMPVVDTTGAQRDGTKFQIIKMFLRDVTVGTFNILLLYRRFVRVDYVEQKFQIYSSVFAHSQSLAEGYGMDRVRNKFICVILRLIKKTFDKWSNMQI